METDIAVLAEEIKQASRGQKTPLPLTDNDWMAYAIDGYKQLYIDIGIQTWEDDFEIQKDVSGTGEETARYILHRKFDLRETRYAFLSGRIAFYTSIAATVNNIASYSTDALSVTGVKNMWSNVNGDREKLMAERQNLFYQVCASSRNS